MHRLYPIQMGKTLPQKEVSKVRKGEAPVLKILGECGVHFHFYYFKLPSFKELFKNLLKFISAYWLGPFEYE